MVFVADVDGMSCTWGQHTEHGAMVDAKQVLWTGRECAQQL